MIWTQLLDLLRALILSVAQVCGGSLGTAVCIVSFVLRLALLPLTLRLARRALGHQRQLLALRPELERIRKKFAQDPAALWRETAALHQRHGVKPVDGAGMAGALVQLPVLGAFFAALRRGIGTGVRFLWVRDLSLPSVSLAIAATILSIAGVALAPSATAERRLTVVPLLVTGTLTLWILCSTSSLFTLASGAGSIVGAVQSLLLRRRERAVPGPA